MLNPQKQKQTNNNKKHDRDESSSIYFLHLQQHTDNPYGQQLRQSNSVHMFTVMYMQALMAVWNSSSKLSNASKRIQREACKK